VATRVTVLFAIILNCYLLSREKKLFVSIAFHVCFRIHNCEDSRKPGGIVGNWDTSGSGGYVNLLGKHINTKETQSLID
jgi:hypothetical protein